MTLNVSDEALYNHRLNYARPFVDRLFESSPHLLEDLLEGKDPTKSEELISKCYQILAMSPSFPLENVPFWYMRYGSALVNACKRGATFVDIIREGNVAIYKYYKARIWLKGEYRLIHIETGPGSFMSSTI